MWYHVATNDQSSHSSKRDKQSKDCTCLTCSDHKLFFLRLETYFPQAQNTPSAFLHALNDLNGLKLLPSSESEELCCLAVYVIHRVTSLPFRA